jgi:hypothetical protein
MQRRGKNKDFTSFAQILGGRKHVTPRFMWDILTLSLHLTSYKLGNTLVPHHQTNAQAPR